MAEFTVTWVINLDVDNSLEAAFRAQEIITNFYRFGNR
jgi:hypothetical protein